MPEKKQKFPCPHSPDRKPFGSKQAKVKFDHEIKLTRHLESTMIQMSMSPPNILEQINDSNSSLDSTWTFYNRKIHSRYHMFPQKSAFQLFGFVF